MRFRITAFYPCPEMLQVPTTRINTLPDDDDACGTVVCETCEGLLEALLADDWQIPDGTRVEWHANGVCHVLRSSTDVLHLEATSTIDPR